MIYQKGLLFTLGHFNLCCPAENMQKVIMLPREKIREVPGVRGIFRGLFVHRDEVLPLLNLELLFQLGESDEPLLAVGVIEMKNKFRFGLTIAEQTEIIDFGEEDIVALDRSPRGLDANFFKGYINAYGKMIFILSIDYFQKYFAD